jgi:hypothetical protein
VRALVEGGFSGFSRTERRRRLTQRCEADMFVCLKNIFASEKLDDIIIREYETLNLPFQEVYKTVAAMVGGDSCPSSAHNPPPGNTTG